MKKFSKIGKRVMALFIVALLNINTYAAVSANDGSAFVTKAEFDALVNTFNEQMDDYENGISSKIDGAIANYLAGLSDTLTSTKNLFFSTWKDVTAFNGAYDPTFVYPALDIIFTGGARNEYTWGSNPSWRKYYNIEFSRKYLYGGGGYATRALVTCPEGESSSNRTYYWGGVTTRYKEQFTINKGLYNNSSSEDMADIEQTGGSRSISVVNGVNINVSNGYNSSFSSNNVISPKILWKSSMQSWSNTVSFSNVTNANVATVNDDGTEANGGLKYAHVISYSGASEWCVSNKNFTKTFRYHSNNSLAGSGVLSSVSKTGGGGATAFFVRTDTWAHQQHLSWNLSFGDTTDTTRTFPSIGMFASDVKANLIHQTDDSVEYDASGVKKTLDDLTLEKGFALFYAKKDTQIEWNPYFTTGLAYSTSSKTWIDSSAKAVRLYLSMVPFSDKIISTELIEATSDSGKTKDGGILCKIGSGETVKWTMPKNGVVYAKWVPDVSTYDSDKWIQPLDLSQCNTYVEIVGQ